MPQKAAPATTPATTPAEPQDASESLDPIERARLAREQKKGKSRVSLGRVLALLLSIVAIFMAWSKLYMNHKVGQVLEQVRQHEEDSFEGNATPMEKAQIWYQNQQYKRAWEVLQPLAQQGDARAQYYVARMLQNEQSVLKNHAEAMQWYEKAAAQDDTLAMLDLALMYEEGIDEPRSYQQAVSWYRKAELLGNCAAQFRLGRMYQHGFGVSQSAISAYALMTVAEKRMSSERGSSDCNSDLPGTQTLWRDKHSLAGSMSREDRELAERIAAGWMLGRATIAE